MAVPHAQPLDVIDVTAKGASQSVTLVKTPSLEVIRLVLPAGKRIEPHQVPREVTLQCLDGAVAVEARGREQVLTAGTMLYLAGGDVHGVRAVDDSSLLLTILL